MEQVGHGRALLNGQSIITRDPGPFNGPVDRIVWVLPFALAGKREWDTYSLRALGHTLEIVYAPRERPIVPFAGIASSLADIESFAPGTTADTAEVDE